MQLKPQLINYFILKDTKVQSLAAGDQHSAAISCDNELYTWGNGDYYRLGHGLCMDELEPKKVEVL
jgi:alpha-tubulin suppressor-like RCC1 family protein